MNRRDFVGSTLAASLLGGSLGEEGFGAVTQDHDKPRPGYYELRQYHLRRGPQVKAMHDLFGGVALPAMTRNGLGPVGVFEVLVGPDSPTVYMLIAHKSIESFATASARVNADQEYQKSGASFINASAGEPAYTRIDSSLMVAFDAAPRLEVPA